MSEDWERVRDVRIRALTDAPFAFGSRLEEEQDRPESVTRESLERQAAATFLAIDGDETVGLVRTFVEPADVTSAELVSMWVAPHARGQRVGRQLVASWCRAHSTTAATSCRSTTVRVVRIYPLRWTAEAP